MYMAVGSRVSLSEYFSACFDGECELVDGALRPKPMGTRDHSRVQGRIYSALLRFEQAGKGEAFVELSLRLDETVLIPDIVFTRPGQIPDQYNVFDTPPLLCVEVISPSQSFGDLYNKCLGYLRWGVSYCWIVDPIKRVGWQLGPDEVPHERSAQDFLEAGEIKIPLSVA